MIFEPCPLKDAFIIRLDPHQDERGFFARSFCQEEFRAHGLNPDIEQCNITYNARRGTLRGMHYQATPHEEDRLVRCIRGAIHDVIIDIRPDSPTYRRWTAVELSGDNRLSLYVPKGFAHGFQTLTDNTEVFYQMSRPFVPGQGRGIRPDDPAFGIAWPVAEWIISERDRGYPDWSG